MSKFPESIPLPEHVIETRVKRRHQMIHSAMRGVLVRSGIILAELLGFIFLSSSVLLLDALSTIIDVASSLFLIFCIRWADKPPDEKHPFGHGRFEPIAGLQLGLLLAVIGGGMFFQQISALTQSTGNKIIDHYTWLIPLCAMVLLELCYRNIKKTAKLQNSPALLIDAVHYRIDSINSLFAMVALLLAAYFPQYSVALDHGGALAIAFLMIIIGTLAARNNINQLLDRIPDKKYFEKVHHAALKVEGVLATEKIRLQVYGPDAHVNIDIEVDPQSSVEIAHEISQKVRTEIQKEWPAVRDVIVHIEPFYPGDHYTNYHH